MTRPIPPRAARDAPPAVAGGASSGTAELLELLAQARQYVPSLTRLAGQIDVHLGLAGVEATGADPRDDGLVLESYGRGHAFFRAES